MDNEIILFLPLRFGHGGHVSNFFNNCTKISTQKRIGDLAIEGCHNISASFVIKLPTIPTEQPFFHPY